MGREIRPRCRVFKGLFSPTPKLPDNNNFDLSKLKEFTCDKIDVVQLMELVSGTVENIIKIKCLLQAYYPFLKCLHAKIFLPDVII